MWLYLIVGILVGLNILIIYFLFKGRTFRLSLENFQNCSECTEKVNNENKIEKLIKKENTDHDFIKNEDSQEYPTTVDFAKVKKEFYTNIGSMIGLGQVKTSFISLFNNVYVQTKRREYGLTNYSFGLHLVFSGNPGTGKTTVARMLGQAYKDLGVLSSGHTVEVVRSDLVGEHIGSTALKTKRKLEDAMGGILFIDEAYSLTNKDDRRDFGHEAIETILKFMEDHRDNMVIIVAGYINEIKEFIDSNPGLKSRFTTFLDFEDYSGQEMAKIANIFFSKYDYKLTTEAALKLEQLFIESEKDRQKYFANARDVRNTVESIIESHSNRIAHIEPENLCKDSYIFINSEDVEESILLMK